MRINVHYNHRGSVEIIGEYWCWGAVMVDVGRWRKIEITRFLCGGLNMKKMVVIGCIMWKLVFGC